MTPMSRTATPGTPGATDTRTHGKASGYVPSPLSSRDATTVAGASLADAALDAAAADPQAFNPLSRLADELGTPGPDTPQGSDLQLLDDQLQDNDDFVIMDESQAKHITQMCEWAFGVELSPDVVIADANVSALARRVIGARNLLDGTDGATEALSLE